MGCEDKDSDLKDKLLVCDELLVLARGNVLSFPWRFARW